MNVVLSAWNRFWFCPTSPTHLSIARIVLYAYIAYRAYFLDSHVWAEFAPIAWKPVSFYQVLGAPPSAVVLRILDWTLLVSALFACVGLFSRASMAITGVLGLYLLGLPNNFYKIDHGLNVLVFALCFMALSRGGDACSADAVLRRRRGASAPPSRSGEYTWPIRAMWVAMALMYFAAGVAKLDRSGLEWAFSDNLKLLLIRHHYTHSPPTHLGLLVAETPHLPRILAFFSLSTECLAPLAIVHRWPRYAIGLGLFGMQVGIWLTLGVFFSGALWCFVIFWAPWGHWIDWVAAKVQHGATGTTALTGGG